nr:hypothetical protein Josef01_22i07_10 [uncultured archaeon]
MFCVIGLESPKVAFRVQHDAITFAASDTAGFAATGTIGPRSDWLATGLGITELVDIHNSINLFSFILDKLEKAIFQGINKSLPVYTLYHQPNFFDIFYATSFNLNFMDLT